MTEEEFYKKKIFEKANITQLRNQYPLLIESINNWYCSQRYNDIQTRKSFLMNKLKQMSKDNEIIIFSNQDLYDFFKWYEAAPKICHYCLLPEADLQILHNQSGHINKRYPKRGQSLEIDRKKSNLPYSNIDNLVLACYWCNNAKTDTFSDIEFISVGQAIKTIWEHRLKKNL